MSVHDKNILVLGDSHVCRFETHLRSLDTSIAKAFRLQTGQSVHLFGFSGGKLANRHIVQAFQQKIEQFRPSFVVIWIGGNDLDGADYDAEQVCMRLVAYVSMLIKTYHLQGVYLPQLMKRLNTRHISVVDYNKRVDIFNHMLQNECSSGKGIFYWRLKHLGGDRDDLYSDGVHLNAKGQRYLFHNIRGAIIRCV